MNNSKLSQEQYVQLLNSIKNLMEGTTQLLAVANQSNNIPLAQLGLKIAYLIEQFNNTEVSQFVGGHYEN